LTTLSPDVLQGAQRPRLVSYPRGVSSSGAEAAEFSALTGLVLDPWQVFALECLMQERADGKWAARTGVLIVPRQNGKGAVDEAWELAQLFLNGCRIVLHTAHHNKTAKSAFLKMRAHIEGSAMLKARLMDDRSGGIRIANGEYGFTFKSGQQLIYGTRTGGAGRGLTIDAMVLDEVQELKDDELDALKPTIATAPNPQTLMTGSAPKDVAEVLPRLMVRGRASDPALCYLEWSVDESQAYELDDRSFWALSNPGYGIRLFDDAIVDERGSMSDSGFARERLGVWSPPSESGVFPAGAWEAAKDVNADMPGVPMFAIEAPEDRKWAAIGAVGAGSQGATLDVVDYHSEMDWVVPRMTELLMKNEASRVCIRPSSPAGSLIPELPEHRVIKVSAQEYAQGCGALYDGILAREYWHLGQKSLDESVARAKRRPSSDAWVWDPRKSQWDISPLAAVTVAAWAHKAHGAMDILASVW
jgi:hypothetical protein